MKDLKTGLLIDLYESFLTEKQVKIMKSFYFNDLSLSEIASAEGISRQAVQDAIKKCGSELNGIEDRLKIFEKNNKIKEITESILSDEKYSADKNLKEKLETILNLL